MQKRHCRRRGRSDCSYSDRQGTPRSDVVAIVFCVLFFGLVGLISSIVILIAANSDGSDSTGGDYNTDFGDSDSKRNSGPQPAGPPLSIDIVVQGDNIPEVTRRDTIPTAQTGSSLRPTTATETRKPTFASVGTTTMTTTPTTTTTEPRKRELVCTVGFSTVEASMYPPDRFCDYLYYTNVVIVGDSLQGAEEQTSWKMFQEQAKTYSRVELGVAFHFRYIITQKLDAARNALDTLARNNIKHYGVLNIIGRLFRLRAVVNGLEDVFEKFKEIQGSDPTRKTIIAIASAYYSAHDVDFYQNLITTTVK
ncbi:uncharacterized protein LOC144134482 [Amblyomma americanum]